MIFPISKSEREGKRGSTTPGDYWVLGVNPRFHVLFQRCRQGQNYVDWMSKMSTIDLFLPNFSLLGCEGSRGSHLTTRPFKKNAAADRPRADMPAPLAYLTTSKHVFSVWWWQGPIHDYSLTCLWFDLLLEGKRAWFPFARIKRFELAVTNLSPSPCWIPLWQPVKWWSDATVTLEGEECH